MQSQRALLWLTEEDLHRRDRWGRILRTHEELAQHRFMALQDSAGGNVHQEGIRSYAKAHGISGGLRVKHRMELSLLSKWCKIRLFAHSAVQTASSTAANLCWSTQALSVDSATRALHPVTQTQEGCGFLLPVLSCTESYLLVDLQHFVPHYHNTKLTSLGCLPLSCFF